MNFWRNKICLILFLSSTACTGGIQFDSSDNLDAEVNPSSVKFSCQSPVLVSESSNFHIVGCVSSGASGDQTSGADATVQSPLQALGSILLGDE